MRQLIIEMLKKAIPEDITIDITVPDSPAGGETRGEYATTVAFALAKMRGKPPLAIAGEIKRALEANDGGTLLRKIEVAKPGFLNFWIAPQALHAELTRILSEGNRYGRAQAARTKKIQVEFISANPTGPLTLANGRGGFLGDVLANVLEAQGHAVEREYYVNDTGNQILTLGKSLLAARGAVPDEETFYKGAYIKEWADAHTDLVTFYKDDPHALGRAAAKDFLGIIKSVIEGKAGILFSRYTSEFDDIHGRGYVEKALALFRSKGVAYEQDGAVWLKTTTFGDDKDRVLMTKDGVPTYFLADAGHYLETAERGFDAKVNILGPDHYGYVARIQAAAQLVGLSDSTVIITQAVRIVQGGEEIKMSKRKGAFVTFDELVAEVSPDVARFFFLMIAADSHLDFDLALAKEHSQKNPVFYAQYALVRARKILEKAGLPAIARPKGDATAGGTPGSCSDFSPLSEESDRRLIRMLAEFPTVLSETARDYHAHRLTKYALVLARVFHDWYERERVIGEPAPVLAARCALVQATVNVFEGLFSVLGISAPQEM